MCGAGKYLNLESVQAVLPFDAGDRFGGHHGGIERELAYRKLALKDSASRIDLFQFKSSYGLPNAQELLVSPLEKLSWKVKVRRSVNESWRKVIIHEASGTQINIGILKYCFVNS